MSRKKIAIKAIGEIVAHKRNKVVAPPEFVEWDRTHGKKLFQWRNDLAADKWRLQQARELIWSLAIIAGKTKARALYNLKAVHNDGQRGYVRLLDIVENGQLKHVVGDLRSRHGNLLLQYKFLGQPIDKLRDIAENIFDEIVRREEVESGNSMAAD